MIRTVAVAVLVAVILAAIGIGAAVVSAQRQLAFAQSNRPQAKDIDLYQGIAADAKLLELDKRALDEAYHQHIIRLWNVWLTDGAREATRVSNGLRIARESYRYASGQIARREQELERR